MRTLSTWCLMVGVALAALSVLWLEGLRRARTGQGLPNLIEVFRGPPRLWVWVPEGANARAPEERRRSVPAYWEYTLRSLALHNGGDFRVEFVTDRRFQELIPRWAETVGAARPEPEQRRWRLLGLCELVYRYGGMVVPPSTLALRSFRTFFERASDAQQRPFFVRRLRPARGGRVGLAAEPDFEIFGGPARHPVLLGLLRALVEQVDDGGARARAAAAAASTPGHLATAAAAANTPLAWQVVGGEDWRAALRARLAALDAGDRNVVSGEPWGREAADRALCARDWAATGDPPEGVAPDLFGLCLDADEVASFADCAWLREGRPDALPRQGSALARLLRAAVVPSEPLVLRALDEKT